jgi:heat shock protein HslJ
MKIFLSIGLVLTAFAQANTMENTKWLLVDLRAGTVVTDSAHFVAAFKLTPAGHVVTGNGGCNVLSGGYTLSGTNGVKIDAFTGTQNACPQPFVDEEKAFLDALKKTTRYQISGIVLTLYAGDNPIAKFEAAH